MKFPVLKISSSFCLMFAVCSRGCEYVCKEVRGAPWSHSRTLSTSFETRSLSGLQLTD